MLWGLVVLYGGIEAGAGMTKREKTIVRAALVELMKDDGDFSGAIASLGALVGLCYPAYEVSKTAQAADFATLASGPRREFSVNWPGRA